MLLGANSSGALLESFHYILTYFATPKAGFVIICLLNATSVYKPIDSERLAEKNSHRPSIYFFSFFDLVTPTPGLQPPKVSVLFPNGSTKVQII